MATIREFIEQWRRRLAAAGVEDPRLNVELLLAHVLRVPRGTLISRLDESLAAPEQQRTDALCARRLAREPIDYILGEREFFGRAFAVRPGVLVPRPETETIIETLKREWPGASGLAVDVGCGCGTIGITLALEFPGLTVLATDISRDALAVARENAARLEAPVRFACMDGLSAAAGPFELIVSNPPYINPDEAEGLQPEVRDFEPPVALFGGPGGLETPGRILAQAASLLRPGGWLLFEHGFHQGEAMRKLAADAGLREVRTVKDMAGLDRVLVARA